MKSRLFPWRRKKETSQEFKPAIHSDRALVLSVTHKDRPSLIQQLRLVRHVFSPKEWRVFIACIALFFVAILLGLGNLAKPHILIVPTAGGAMSEAVVGSPKLINPLFAPLNDVDRDLASLVYAGLFRLDETLEPVPDLVDSYRWMQDQTTLEITLRKDARFHDGETVTADDVVFTYQAVKDPTWRSPLTSQYRFLKPIRIDNHTVQFQMDKMHPNVLSDLTLGILPAHVWEGVANANASLAEANLRPIGSGPYAVTSFTRDSKGTILSYTLKRFDTYHGTKPYVDQWVFHFFEDRVGALQAARNHQVDAIAFVPWKDAVHFKNLDFQSIPLELPQETVAFFNTKDPVLKDKKIRKALTLAIDTQELQEIVGPHASTVSSPFPFFRDTGSSSTAPNIEAARALLEAQGWKLVEGQTVRSLPAKSKTASSTPLALSIDVPNDQSDLQQVAEYLKRRWSLLGAQVSIRVSNPDTLLSTSLDERAYQVLMWNVLLSAQQDLSPFWSSKNTSDRGLNLSNLSDKEVDNALAALTTATSTEAARKIQVQLAQAILDEYPALFLIRPSYAYLVSNRIRGTHSLRIAQPAHRLLNTKRWYIKTSWRWK
ncbi:peptide ABC transporter substrate-binding protein [Candidatus Uhrbacteria bacterium]|nr:peptide ABC transporter substrate-binding protein [Candidatus Uhrbacteria bacterium]